MAVPDTPCKAVSCPALARIEINKNAKRERLILVMGEWFNVGFIDDLVSGIFSNALIRSGVFAEVQRGAESRFTYFFIEGTTTVLHYHSFVGLFGIGGIIKSDLAERERLQVYLRLNLCVKPVFGNNFYSFCLFGFR